MAKLWEGHEVIGEEGDGGELVMGERWIGGV
jgi:hypothetical protein